MDFMICLLESVRQEESFKSFVCLSVRSVAFPVAENHGSQLLPCSHQTNHECTVLSRVSQTQLLPRSHSVTHHDRAMVQTVINQHNIN